MILRDRTAQDDKKIKALLKTAFPREERPPFFFLKSRLKKQRAQMLIADEAGTIVGFAYLVCLRDMVYVFFLAVADANRGKGYGSKILQLLQKEYAGKRIFLARERIDPDADNNDQRMKRHSFYLKNGFEDLPYQIKEARVVYDMMGIGGGVSAGEYKELISLWTGPLLSRLVDMRIVE